LAELYYKKCEPDLSNSSSRTGKGEGMQGINKRGRES